MRAYLPGSAQICRDDRGGVRGEAAPYSSPPRYVTPQRPPGPTMPALGEALHPTRMCNLVCGSIYNEVRKHPGCTLLERPQRICAIHTHDNSAATAGARIPSAEEGRGTGACREGRRCPRVCRESPSRTSTGKTTQRPRLSDSTGKCLQQADPQRQRAGEWLRGLGVRQGPQWADFLGRGVHHV